MTRKKIVCVCIDQACTKLTFSNEHSQVVIYNKNTGILWYDLGIADAEISGLHFKDDCDYQLIAICKYGKVLFWNFHFEKKVLSIKAKTCIAHSKDVTHINSNKNYIITASEDSTIIVWNGKTAAYISPVSLASICPKASPADYVNQIIILPKCCVVITFFGLVIGLNIPSFYPVKGASISIGQNCVGASNGSMVLTVDMKGDVKIIKYDEEKESLANWKSHDVKISENDQILSIVGLSKRASLIVSTVNGICTVLSYKNGVIGQIGGRDWPYKEIMKPNIDYIYSPSKKDVCKELNPLSVKDHSQFAKILEEAIPTIGRRYTLLKGDHSNV